MSKNIDPVRETDDAAIDLAGKLIAENRYAALGVKQIGDGTPLVSRIAYAWTPETGLFFSASDLSMHSSCLVEDPICSMMIGEPGKGDGLAHPRITLIGKASRLPNQSTERHSLRKAFLAVHPKAELYVDFADFGFYPVEVDRALLNGGFGKAYHLEKSDLAILSD